MASGNNSITMDGLQDENLIDCSEEESKSGSSNVDRSSSGTYTEASFYGSTNDSKRTSDDDAYNIKNVLAKHETQQVFRLRILVILILIAAATSISVTIYFIVRNADTDEFELQYYGAANKVVDAFQEVLVQMSAVSGIAVSVTADTLKANSTESWPFVTMSNFQERAGSARKLSGAIYVSINPIVESNKLSKWERYVQSDANYWVEEGLAFQDRLNLNNFVSEEHAENSWLTRSKVDPLHTFDESGRPRLSFAEGPFLPRWQSSPVLRTSLVNENLLEDPKVSQTARDCMASNSAVLGGFVSGPPGSTTHPDRTTSSFATFQSIWDGQETEYLGDPMSNLLIPIFDKLSGTDREVVGVLISTIHWRAFMVNLLPGTIEALTVVMQNVCDGNFTYELRGDDVNVVGFGDQHDRAFDEFEVVGRFRTDNIDDGTTTGIPLNQEGCPYTFHVYPTQQGKDSYTTNDPLVVSLSVAAVFLFTLFMFFFYNHLVERRQRLVVAKANQSTAIVSSLFPKQVRDRLLAMEDNKKKGDSMVAPVHRLKTFLNGQQTDDRADQPIADFFPHCTVFFADIAGFTAWSSSREPAQVFLLLQTLYQNFDLIAKRRRVFKVETIGDSYVAVTGLPEPQANHAAMMAKFAWDCLIRVGEVMKELEVSLGPDTGELSMRFGLHSGSVTAGVLRGDRARFQLFGDTVNTAARMESTGVKGRIQVSATTAEILTKAGKEAWLTRREDKVRAKGKGVLSTFWLALQGGIEAGSSSASIQELVETSTLFQQPSDIDSSRRQNLKEIRLIDWVADIILEHIKKVVIVHERCRKGSMSNDNVRYIAEEGRICLDEVQEAIHMPKFDARVTEAALDSNKVIIPIDISDALREYVAFIAGAYRNNPFHNFEHACHVTMSVNKLLSRVATPDLSAPKVSNSLRRGREEVAAEIHNFSHGITSDPMAVFAIVFAALIHDVDHPGVSNAQLIKEEPDLAKLYRDKSVAEQNSLDVAWDMLMTERFDKLRKYVFGTQSELLKFRQLIVNVVLATDIFDKELGQLRKDRWERAFHDDGNLPSSLINDLRATIVMEHIIQASDVSHTMQHWHVYQKWNRRLFEEMYRAWSDGRMGADPREFWYKGELGFFDNYVIPLANKLKNCNVFGVSSDEYLGYAIRNREEWAERGEGIVKSLIWEIEESKRLSSATIPALVLQDDGTSSLKSQSSNDGQVEESSV